MEYTISKAICERWFDKLQANLQTDVIIVGGGPSGLICAAELAQEGIKTCLIEGKLAPGGGMWGGAMLFNSIVVQAEVLPILDRYGIKYLQAEQGLYTVDAVEATSALIYQAAHRGAAIFMRNIDGGRPAQGRARQRSSHQLDSGKQARDARGSAIAMLFIRFGCNRPPQRSGQRAHT
jgi:monoamine oxidase